MGKSFTAKSIQLLKKSVNIDYISNFFPIKLGSSLFGWTYKYILLTAFSTLILYGAKIN